MDFMSMGASPWTLAILLGARAPKRNALRSWPRWMFAESRRGRPVPLRAGAATACPPGASCLRHISATSRRPCPHRLPPVPPPPPTPTAPYPARLAADEVIRVYTQTHGEIPRASVVDLWGSA